MAPSPKIMAGFLRVSPFKSRSLYAGSCAGKYFSCVLGGVYPPGSPAIWRRPRPEQTAAMSIPAGCTSACYFKRSAPGTYVCAEHKTTHLCGRRCTAPKHYMGCGTFCALTGVETAGAPEVLYSNPLQRDSYSRRTGGAHWHYQKSTLRRTPTAHATEAARCRQHTPSRITAALRKIFSSSAYQTFIDKERGRRQSYVCTAIGKHRRRRLTLAEAAVLSKNVSSKFAGAAKTTLPITDHRLELIRESLIVFARGEHSEKPLLSIKSTAAYVAAVLTLLSSGLWIDGHAAFPKLPWLRAHLPPPVAMTAVGVPCRSVSLAVRQLKKHVFGPDFEGRRLHFFKVSRTLVTGALAL